MIEKTANSYQAKIQELRNLIEDYKTLQLKVKKLTEEEKKAILDLALKTDGGKWDAVTLADLAAVTGKDPDKVYFAVLLVTALDKI